MSAGDNERDALRPDGSMTGRRLAWGVATLPFAFLVTAAVVAESAGGSVFDIVGVGFVSSIAFPVLGAFVVGRRGSPVVGWLMIGIGVTIAFHSVALKWGEAALVDDPGSLPAGELASWVGVWAWMLGWLLVTTLLPVMFPDGRPTGQLRLLAWIDGIAVAAFTGVLAAYAWHLRGPLLVQSESSNTPAEHTLDRIVNAGFAVIAVLTLASMGSLLLRHRRATPEARRQIAWVVYGAAVAAVMSVIGTFFDAAGVLQVLEASALVGGLAVAMYRYRLYNIAVIGNRTLVYGPLTATLAGAYLGCVLLMQLVLSPSSSVAVAVSTLAAAALLRPARNAFPGDRRRALLPAPPRRRADARAGFGAGVRNQVDLRALEADLCTVVRVGLQPAHVSMWLRPPGSGR
jgi:hypothetical protein